MVDPFASRSFDLPDPVTAPSGAVALEYWFVNDYGGNVNGHCFCVVGALIRMMPRGQLRRDFPTDFS